MNPKTPDEIAWFSGMMGEELKKVTSMSQLQAIWQENVVAVAALPEKERAAVIAIKDAVKKNLTP